MVYFMKREIQKEDGNMKLKNTLAIIVLSVLSTILMSTLGMPWHSNRNYGDGYG
jgi:hypothetical protein